MRWELTFFHKKSFILLPKHLQKYNTTLFIECLATEIVKTYKHLVGISREQENNVYKNGNKIAIFDVFYNKYFKTEW